LPLRIVNNRKERFLFYHKKGVVLPGQAFDIPIAFTSKKPGIFTEKWRISTEPRIMESDGHLKDLSFTLQAMVIASDTNREARREVETYLSKKMSSSFVGGIVSNIIEDAMYRSTHRQVKVEERDIFLAKNTQHTSVYHADVVKTMKQLFESAIKLAGISKEWDYSIDQLMRHLMLVPDANEQSKMLQSFNAEIQKLNTLQMQPAVSNDRYAIGYDIMIQFLDSVSEGSDNIRIKYKLPLIRPCVLKYKDRPEDGMGGDDHDAGDKKGGAKAGAPADDKKKGAAQVRITHIVQIS
jgi:hypothetical protein